MIFNNAVHTTRRFVPDDEREDVLRHVVVPVVEEEGVVPSEAVSEGRGQTTRVGDDGHVGAVTEGLGAATADRLRPVRTDTPHVACNALHMIHIALHFCFNQLIVASNAI